MGEDLVIGGLTVETYPNCFLTQVYVHSKQRGVLLDLDTDWWTLDRSEIKDGRVEIVVRYIHAGLRFTLVGPLTGEGEEASWRIEGDAPIPMSAVEAALRARLAEPLRAALQGSLPERPGLPPQVLTALAEKKPASALFAEVAGKLATYTFADAEWLKALRHLDQLHGPLGRMDLQSA